MIWPLWFFLCLQTTIRLIRYVQQLLSIPRSHWKRLNGSIFHYVYRRDSFLSFFSHCTETSHKHYITARLWVFSAALNIGAQLHKLVIRVIDTFQNHFKFQFLLSSMFLFKKRMRGVLKCIQFSLYRRKISLRSMPFLQQLTTAQLRLWVRHTFRTGIRSNKVGTVMCTTDGNSSQPAKNLNITAVLAKLRWTVDLG